MSGWDQGAYVAAAYGFTAAAIAGYLVSLVRRRRALERRLARLDGPGAGPGGRTG